MNMKIRLPNAELTRSIDDMLKLSNDFHVNATVADDALIIEADEEALLDFMTAYHNIDVLAAKETMSSHAMKNAQSNFCDCSPDFALQKINEFVIANGGFEGYHNLLSILQNALHGIG